MWVMWMVAVAWVMVEMDGGGDEGGFWVGVIVVVAAVTCCVLW
jgi:hypothetical protein